MTVNNEKRDKIEAIIQAACEVCGVRPEELRKRSRTGPLSTSRALVAHFLYRQMRMSPQEILPLIGNPEYARTAIYHYVGRKTLIENRSPYQKHLQIKAEQIRKRLG